MHEEREHRDARRDRRVHERRVLSVDEAPAIHRRRGAVEGEQAVLPDERRTVDPASQVAVVDGVVI